MKLTQAAVKATFILDYESGWLSWLTPASKKLKPGDRAGSINERGYIIIRWNNKPYKAHRLIFLYVNGYLPKFVDHEDNVRHNNRPPNLRGANAKKNACNKKKAAGKTSAYKGVCVTRNGRHKAQIAKDRVVYHLGTFVNEIKAARAYNKAARKLHGRFASVNVFK